MAKFHVIVKVAFVIEAELPGSDPDIMSYPASQVDPIFDFARDEVAYQLENVNFGRLDTIIQDSPEIWPHSKYPREF